MIISINNPQIHFNKESQTFSAYLSDIERNRFEITRFCREGRYIYVKNEKTGKQIKMTRHRVDTDSTGEDTYGWQYRGFNPQNQKVFYFLFIND